jgi:hypothetical protein
MGCKYRKIIRIIKKANVKDEEFDPGYRPRLHAFAEALA